MRGFCKVRYGTALMPFENAYICAKFPGLPPLRPLDPRLVSSDSDTLNLTRPFDGCTALCEREMSVEVPPRTTGFPSVSLISSAVSEKRALYRWQHQMMKDHGKAGLAQFVRRRMNLGSLFHKVAELLLKELRTNGKIESNPVDVLRKQKNAEGFESELIPSVERIGEFLYGLQPNPLIQIESSAAHPLLCYTGRFDAVIELDGELTLVDWKTVNAESIKSQTIEEKLPADLYDNPVQLAAYVASVNSNPAFHGLPMIKRAAVVLVYEDGRGVEVVKMDAAKIEYYFEEFRRRLNEFWWRVENDKPRAGVIQLTYNPMFVNPKKVDGPSEYAN